MGTDPYAKREPAGESKDGIDIFKQVVRIAGGLTGVIAMVIGLVYAAKMLKLLFMMLTAPEGGRPVLMLAEMFGGAEFVVPSATGAIPLAVPLAVFLLVLALLVMGRLALGLIMTGAKVLAFCLTDRESMKELLVYALGKKQKAEENKPASPA